MYIVFQENIKFDFFITTLANEGQFKNILEVYVNR